MKQHVFEVPLYVRPSAYFQKFLRDLGNPMEHHCEVKYWRKKLTFFSSTLDQDGRKASVSPFAGSLSESEIRHLEKHDIYLFASKFNATMSLRPRGDLDVSLELITDYASDEAARLRVTVTCGSLATEMALDNFFMIIDSSFLQ